MSAFKDYATGTAFALSLSKPQIDCLCQIEQRGGSWALLMTSYALQRKGLIERQFVGDGHDSSTWTMSLTEAGVALMPLLKLAGLWTDYTTPETVQIAAPGVRVREELA
jgi:hypothetical protein